MVVSRVTHFHTAARPLPPTNHKLQVLDGSSDIQYKEDIGSQKLRSVTHPPVASVIILVVNNQSTLSLPTNTFYSIVSNRATLIFVQLTRNHDVAGFVKTCLDPMFVSVYFGIRNYNSSETFDNSNSITISIVGVMDIATSSLVHFR